jgi:hypothetical protein
MRKWVSLEALPLLTRQRILDANDLLDAIDEAEEDRAKENAPKRDR